LIGFSRLFLLSESHYLLKNQPVAGGPDRILAYAPAVDPFHNTVETALSWIDQNAPPKATLAVLPEGAMINYLSRRVNPTPCLVWVPPLMKIYGTSNMVTAFENKHPDYVVMVARSGAEFGVGFFGYDPRFGADLKKWIDDHYDRVYPAPGPAAPAEAGQPFFAELQIFKYRMPASGRLKN